MSPTFKIKKRTQKMDMNLKKSIFEEKFRFKRNIHTLMKIEMTLTKFSAELA